MTTFTRQISIWVCAGVLLAFWLSFSMQSRAAAQDITVSEQSFG